MRIISGKYKGSKLKGFDIEGTRVTMDRVKESVLGMVQFQIKDTVVLDLFCGSGSIGLEFLSNGAKCCYFVDNNPKVIDILNENINKLKITEKYVIWNKDYNIALKSLEKTKFDIIYLDPPYKSNKINKALRKIAEYDLLNDNGLIICEYEDEFIEKNSFELIKEKKYGNKFIKIYKKPRTK
ncbi:MAG: 16S rRNA (guanine(966)-N(2))-methyltransferase RsmD [Bacilli bacterium]|nr:16S rRNA (guanine(966)-N(2))-methyltransferase RsmD [Bacilli bacterium]MDD4733788.1 16S rRNA (guanine(966)-N(2))-methyltransferase RsmD [Bacilli bacterium]